MSTPDDPAKAPAYIFGPNGTVIGPAGAQAAPDQETDEIQNATLEKQTPEPLRAVIAWTLAGPLNPFGLVITGMGCFFPMGGLDWPTPLLVILLPSAIAAGIGIYYISKHARISMRYLLALAVKMLFLVGSVIIGLLVILMGVIGPVVAAFGLLYLAIIGLPAALCGAAMFRLILFRRINNNSVE